jgi:hypothetical protein
MLVGIPTLGLSPYLERLALDLEMGGHSVILWCNGGQEDAVRVTEQFIGYTIVLTPGVGIYGVWNRILRAGFGEPVAILNDDVYVDSGAIHYADLYLRHRPGAGIVGWDPDCQTRGTRHDLEVTGTYRAGGITGFAFVIRPVDGIQFDEEFTWWGGDDDIVHQYLQAGYKAVKMVGEPVQHWPSTSANARPAVYSLVDQDRQRLLDKWGETW